MHKDPKKEYFSTAEVAHLLRISRIAVFKKIQSGIIPATKIGRGYAISREAVEVLMGSKLTESQKEEIKKVVKKATDEFRDTFERLAKE
jgi:excisionase family DNA binding protein